MRRWAAFAAVALACTPCFAVEGLRTLFHSAEERERLDRLRRGEAAQGSEAASAPRAPPAVTGFVKRSDGRTTVWLDGRPVTLSGPAAAPYTDPAKVRGGERPTNPAIQVKPSPPAR